MDAARQATKSPPSTPGHYWAKWRIATDSTFEGEDLTPSDRWEIVQVNINDPAGSVGEPEYFSVSVPGVREVQWLDQFFWGPGPLPEPSTAAGAGA